MVEGNVSSAVHNITMMLHDSNTPAEPFVGLETFDKIDFIEPSFATYGPRLAPEVNHRRLGVVGIVSILYVYLCAGPFGTESVISSAGPLVGIVGFLLYALLVAFPFASIVAELCSAFPEDGGFTVWVLNAFGPFWAFQVGYWSWIAGVMRGALMPSALLGLLTRFYNIDMESSAAVFFIKAAMTIALAIPTFVGTRTVSWLCTFVAILVIFVFTVFSVWAFSQASNTRELFQIRREHIEYSAETDRVTSTGKVSIQWTILLNTLFFKFKGIGEASVFGGEVRNPAHSYSRAISITCFLILVTYIVPMVAGIVSDALAWYLIDRESFPFFAYYVGGSFLRTLVQIASYCGSAGMCMVALHVNTFLVSGMAENRLIPKILAKRSVRYQSPRNAALLTLVVMLVMINFDFESMLTMTNAFSAAVQLIIIATIIKLRSELPYIARPTKVPGGTPALCVMAVVPTFMFGYITFYALCSKVSAILMVVVFVPGVVYAGHRFYLSHSPV